MNVRSKTKFHPRKASGFTLLDLIASVTILSVASAIAIPSYEAYADRARASQALNDIQQIQLAIDQFNARTFAYPDDLNQLAGVPTTDPWGNPYGYLRIEGNPTPGIQGLQRKDKNLNPLNSDFDLFSNGPDTKTKPPLTAADAKDDLVRAGNGGFLGVAADH